ncbi:hypothetical protein GYMLUDRAFT_244836 [Collybiopsis luxurians FD-317 M1]|uniref:Uncharacterized protein n=1 Tax=Collybiopsis luxurians FD-317 M1 TaxID=944289 RepID=A0A0D0CVM3_9AGAR|nr:hypothetical protein GYMLUDRAFT_244836 [Collybiopsis luxurians FD-317 M1]
MFKLAQADGVLDEAEILLFHFARTAATANGLHVLTASEFQTNTLSKFAQVTHNSQYAKPLCTKQHHDGRPFYVVSPFSATYDVPASDAVTSVRDERLMDHCKGGHNINTLCHGPSTNGPDSLEKRSFCTLCLIVDSFQFLLHRMSLLGVESFDGDLALLAELRTVMSTVKVFCTTGVQDIEARVSKWTVMNIAPPVGWGVLQGYGTDYDEGENFVLDQQAIRSALKASSVTMALPDVHL